MANPTLPHITKRHDSDGEHLEVEGIIVDDKVVLKAQESNVADIAALTAFTVPLVAQAVAVVSEAATDLDTVAAALKTLHTEMVALRVQVVAMNAVLENHGLSADA